MEDLFTSTINMPAWVPIAFLLITIVAKVLNTATQHFSEKKGFVKWALFIVDVLDIFKSTTRPAFRKNSSGKTVPTILLAIVLSGASGCATLPIIAGEACKWIPVAQVAHKAICDVLQGNAKSKCLKSYEVSEKVAAVAKQLDQKSVKVCQ